MEIESARMEESAGARERRGGKERESERDARNAEGRKMEEDGRGVVKGGRGMVRGPCAIKVGIEVVVRNDNTSTDVSIILPRGISYAIGLQNCYLVTRFFKKSID